MFDVTGILLALGVFALGLVATSSTSFGHGRSNPGPFWIQSLVEVPIFILPGVVLTSLEGVRELWIFANITESDYRAAIFAIYYGLACYFVAVYTFDRVIRAFTRRPRMRPMPPRELRLLARLLVVLQLLALAAIALFVDRLPALGLLTGEDVGVLRRAATIDFRGPTVLLSLVKLYGYLGLFLLAVMPGMPGMSGRRSLRTLLWLTSLCCMVWSGEKSPAVIGFLGYWFVRAHHERQPITLRRLLPLAAAAIGLSAAMFAVVGGGDEFSAVEYVMIRAFLGQISGFFQTIGIFTPDPRYFQSWIPLAGSLSDQLPVFARDLMVMTEGDTDTSGTLNTLFLGEAYGAGGWPMLLLSPFIVAGSVVISLHLLRAVLTRYAGSEFATCGLFLFVMNSWLTSGMAGFPAFRGLIFVAFVLATVVVPYRLLRAIARLPVRPAAAAAGR